MDTVVALGDLRDRPVLVARLPLHFHHPLDGLSAVEAVITVFAMPATNDLFTVIVKLGEDDSGDPCTAAWAVR